MEKISIILPIYKVEKYLRQCVDSIINQTYKNLEIILVDDGSPDNCGNICDEYAKLDGRIKVIHKENGGLSDARNKGIDVATGKYISFIDSDDYIAEDMYELLYNNIIKENAEISCCNRYTVYENKEVVLNSSKPYEVMDSKRAIELICTIGHIAVAAYAKLYDIKLFKDIRYPKGKLNEDMYTTYKLFDLANKIVYDATPKYYYRQRKGSITNNNRVNVNAIEASKEMMEFAEKKYPEVLNATIKNYIFSSIGVYDSILKNRLKNNSMKRQIREEVKKYYKIIAKEKDISNARKMQLYLIRHFSKIYDICFLVFHFTKNKVRKVVE